MANYDTKLFINYMFGSASYKLAEEFLPAVSGRMDTKELVTKWLNNETNLKILSCIDKFYDYKEQVKDDEASALIEAVHNHLEITIEDWQNKTKGTCLLIANDKIFVSTPVAILMILSYGGEAVRNDVLPVIKGIEQNDVQYLQYFNNELDSLGYLIRIECVHELAEIDRYWYSFWYKDDQDGHADVLYKRAQYMIKCIKMRFGRA